MALDLDLWRDRLRYAKAVYERAGIIGHTTSTMRLLFDFYRGNQWNRIDGWGELESRDRYTANKIFPTTNTLIAEVTARIPGVNVRARNGESEPNREAVQALLDYDISEGAQGGQVKDAVADGFFAPMGSIRHGFTPREEWDTGDRLLELYRPARPDRPWIRRVAPWNCLQDPTAERFGPESFQKWVAFRDIVNVAYVRDNPNMTAVKGLADAAGTISPEWERLGFTADVDREDPDQNDYIELWTVYEKEERTWFQMTLDILDKPLRGQDDWPIPWEWLPVSNFSINEQRDTNFPIAVLDPAADVQEEINKVRTMISVMTRSIRRVTGVSETKLADGEAAKLANSALIEFIRTTGDPKEALHAIQTGGLPQELLQYASVLEEDLREVVGQSKMGRAQRINVESAHEASFVQQGQNVSTGRVADGVESFWLDVERNYMQARRYTIGVFGAPEIVPIVGPRDVDGVRRWATVSPAEIQGDFDYEIVAGSTRPRNIQQEIATTGAALQMAIAKPEFFKGEFFARKWVEAMGFDPSEAMVPSALVNSYIATLDSVRAQLNPGEQTATSAPDPSAVIASIQQGQGGQGPVQ